MARRKRYAVVLGTRPEFIKLSAFLQRLPEFGVDLFTIHTGQHFDENMSGIFFTELGVPAPDITITIPHGQQSRNVGVMIAQVEEAIRCEAGNLDGVIVLGDTFSSLAGGIAAAHLRLPLIHIEAGLRSNDRRMPEELNRIIIDHLADHLFITETSAEGNLIAEGIPPERIYFVGNIGIESFERMRNVISERNTHARFGLTPKQYRIATMHRQEHTHDPEILKRLCATLSALTKNMPLIVPLHPMTRRKLEEYGLMHHLNVSVTEPLGYLDFMSLVMDSAGVATDSGGIQEEAAHLGIPCATLRDNTERPVTVDLGSNKLFPPTTLHEGSLGDIEVHLSRTDFISGVIPKWDSEVSRRIAEYLS